MPLFIAEARDKKTLIATERARLINALRTATGEHAELLEVSPRQNVQVRFSATSQRDAEDVVDDPAVRELGGGGWWVRNAGARWPSADAAAE